MKMRSSLILVALLACGAAPVRAETPAAPSSSPEPLRDTIVGLDADVFAAFNACADPKQLARHAAFFANDVEFYHDNGGVTWSRRAMLAKTRRNVCGRYRRESVPGTLEVFPIQDFGALETGEHRFCRFDTGRCEGRAKFSIIWRRTAGGWRITRVFSYGHRADD